MANSPARSGIDVGSVIADTYTIEALIGRGGMGAVFLASHKRLPGKKVAIKMLHADLSGEEVLRRFEREAQIASKLGHPNIVGVTDYNVLPDGTPYLVLEYLEGESLAQHLQSGPMPIDRVMAIVRQIGSALAAAHREGIIHRDLKPQNIFLVPSEVENRVVDVAKVLDFGISKIRGSQTVKTQEAALLGTPQYMAPEQATGQHDKVDERTDVFALGAIVHEMLCGQPAFSGANIPEVVFKVVYEQPADLAALAPSTPAPVLAAVKRAMAKKAEDRFQNVADFVEALTGQPLAIVPKPSSIPPPDGGPKSRNTGKAAFDATVGSGDHAQAAGVAATAASGDHAKAVQGTAPTVDSANGAAAIPVRGTAPTVDSASRVSAPVPHPRKPRALPFVLAGVIVAGGIAAFAMTRGHDKRATVAKAPRPEREELRPEPVAVEPPPPPTRSAEPPPTPVPPPVHEAAPKKPPELKKPRVEAPATEPAAAEDETAAAKLRDAQAALAAQDYEKAERLANAVITAEHAGPNQIARAHVVHGVVACVAHNSLSNANADARALAKNPKLLASLVERCAKANIDLRP